MAEIPQAVLEGQKELLREIRDELRGANQAAGAPSGGGFGGVRPSPAVLSAQMTADRMLAGEWASFKWSDGYRPVLQSSITQDILALTGLGRAPNTLTQFEYEALARDSLIQRGIGTVGSLIAPQFTARTAALGQDIFANSSRFIRFGNANASALGTGFGYVAANRLAREIQVGALSDLRLSGDDYATIAQTGMRAGQFDTVSNTSEFKAQLRDLASATADLTRTLRVSVSEVAQAMGTLRTMGVTDPSDQRRMLIQVGAAAQVAGMSTGEVISRAQDTAVAAMQRGLSGQLGFSLATSTLAQTRALSQAGAISPTLMAMGGGVGGIQSRINGAQMDWLASGGGYMQMLGGIGSGTEGFTAMFRGIGATGGTFAGTLAAQAGKIDVLEKLGSQPGAIDRAYVESVKAQLRLFGISDFTSPQARDAAFSIVRGSMGDAAGLAFSRANFSHEGLRIKDQAKLNEMRAEDTLEAKTEYDKFYTANSFRGRVQAGIRNISSVPARIYSWGMNKLDPGQSGWLGVGGQYGYDRAAIAMGATPDSVRFSDLGLAATTRNAVVDPGEIVFQGGATGATAGALLGGAALAAGGAWAGRWAGLKYGAMLGGLAGPLGMIAGGALGMFAGGQLGAMLGGLVDANASPLSIGGNEARDYLAVAKATTKASAGMARGRELVQNGVLAGNREFNELMRTADRTGMDVNKSRDFAAAVSRVAQQTGVSKEDVVGALKVQGMQIEMTNAYALSGKADEKVMAADVKTLTAGTSISANLALSSSASTLKEYLAAVDSGDNIALGKARMQMATLGITGGDLDKLTTNFRGLDAGARSKMAANFGLAAAGGASLELNRSLLGAARFAEVTLDELQSAGAGAGTVDAARKALRGTADDRRKLLDLLDEGSAEGAPLRDLLSRQTLFKDVMEVGKGIDLQTAAAEEIARKYHGFVKADEVTEARGRGVDLRRAIQARMLQQRGGAEAEAAGATKEAALLNDAARILERLGDKLQIKANPK